ncbi:MAG: hypothetical protein ACPGGD_10820, partial [Thalassolituus sp.]
MADTHKRSESDVNDKAFMVHVIQAFISFAILLLVFYATHASAIETVHYSDKKVSLLPLLEFVSERNGETLDEILVRPESDWHHRDSISNNLGQTDNALWARVRLSGITESFSQPIIR